VYSPLDETLPDGSVVLHVAAAVELLTVALNCCVLLVDTDVMVGLTVTETAGAAAMLIDSDAVAVCTVADESFACTENEDEPDAVGVPEIAPLEAFNVKPPGSEPEATLHV
jgi:hypothetical protein